MGPLRGWGCHPRRTTVVVGAMTAGIGICQRGFIQLPGVDDLPAAALNDNGLLVDDAVAIAVRRLNLNGTRQRIHCRGRRLFHADGWPESWVADGFVMLAGRVLGYRRPLVRHPLRRRGRCRLG